MEHLLGTIITVTVWVWVAAEVALQVGQLVRSGRTERSETGSLLVFVVLVGGALELAGPVRHVLPALSYRLSVPLELLVLPAALAGIGVRLWAIVTLGRFFRGTVHIQQDHQVVTTGPYRWVRHPAYSGILLAGTALGLTIGNLASWALFLLCSLAATAYRIRIEERMLTAALGRAYREYADRTPRLVPGVW